MKNDNEVYSVSLNKNEPSEISSQTFRRSFPQSGFQRSNTINAFNKRSEIPSNLHNVNNGKSNSMIKNILDKMVNIKKTNMRISNDITKDICSTIRKDKLIFSVRQEASFMEKQNDYLKGTYEKVDKLKEKCESNKKAVTEYHRNLLEQYENCMETVTYFEREIKEMKNEEIFLEKSHQNKLFRINQSKAEIESEINEILRRSDTQQKEIKGLEKEIEESLRLKERERKQIEANTKKEDQIIRNLEKNLEGLSKKIHSLEIKEENKGEDLVSEEEFKQGQNNIPQIKEDLDIKLNECKQQNIVLVEQIKELSSIINAAKKKALFEEAERKRLQEENQLEEEKNVHGRKRADGVKKGRHRKELDDNKGNMCRSKSSISLHSKKIEMVNTYSRERCKEGIKFDMSVNNIVKK